MVDDVALGVLAALAAAGALATEGRGATQVVRAVQVAVALVPATLERLASVARQTAAGRHAVDYLAFGVGAAGVRVLARRLCNHNIARVKCSFENGPIRSSSNSILFYEYNNFYVIFSPNLLK